MGISPEQLQRAIAKARALQSQGYFTKVAQGDQHAASLFARLVAYELNPVGSRSDYGWLSKSPGESQVDGFAEDAIVFGADDSDLQNVVDLVNGAGAAGASIGGAVKERRPHNKWVAPKPLTTNELSFLREGAAPPVPQPPQYPPYPGDEVWDAMGVVLFADYKRANDIRPNDPNTLPNPGMSRWFGRVEYDWLTGNTPTLQAAIDKQRPNWCAALGIPIG